MHKCGKKMIKSRKKGPKIFTDRKKTVKIRFGKSLKIRKKKIKCKSKRYYYVK